jgi:hypothetical protein
MIKNNDPGSPEYPTPAIVPSSLDPWVGVVRAINFRYSIDNLVTHEWKEL